MLTDTQYDTLKVAHLGASKREAYGDAPMKETLCGNYAYGEAVLNAWSFRTVAKHHDNRRRPCQDCQRIEGRYI